MTAPVRVVVATLTYRRSDHISELVPLLLAQSRGVGPGYTADVLVVDNDPQAGAGQAVDAFAAADLRYVVESAAGISAARNRAIDESGAAELLVFIDDDERPSPGWLDALLATQQATGAAAVAAGVVSHFEGTVDPWIVAGGFFARRHRIDLATGSSIPVAATNNLLLDLRVVRSLGLRFDPAFGLSGGEDSLFTQLLTRSGASMVWCADATVTESVPADRITRRWVLLRSISSGNSEAQVALRLAGSGAGLRLRLTWLTGGLARVGAGLLRAAGGAVVRSNRHQARGLRAAARGAGMAGGAIGWHYQEYRRDPAGEPARSGTPA
jgi:succinoglycan biosynthesis protein ExoM